MADATVVVIFAGNFEYIGIRDRETQTLYISDLLHLKHLRNPAYGKLHTGLHCFIVYETIERFKEESVHGTAPGHDDDDDDDKSNGGSRKRPADEDEDHESKGPGNRDNGSKRRRKAAPSRNSKTSERSDKAGGRKAVCEVSGLTQAVFDVIADSLSPRFHRTSLSTHPNAARYFFGSVMVCTTASTRACSSEARAEAFLHHLIHRLSPKADTIIPTTLLR